MFFDDGVPFPHHWWSIIHLWERRLACWWTKSCTTWNTAFYHFVSTNSSQTKSMAQRAISTYYLPHILTTLKGFEKKRPSARIWSTTGRYFPNAPLRCHTLVGVFSVSARALPDTPGIDFKWKPTGERLGSWSFSFRKMTPVGVFLTPLSNWFLYIQ